MNEEQRTITELKKRNAELEEKVSALEHVAPQLAPLPGHPSRPMPRMGIGLAEFWFGRKKNCRRST
jgi:hypothetical protein